MWYHVWYPSHRARNVENHLHVVFNHGPFVRVYLEVHNLDHYLEKDP